MMSRGERGEVRAACQRAAALDEEHRRLTGLTGA
jgi:hypothetical protein